MADIPRYLQVKQDIAANPQKYAAAEGAVYQKHLPTSTTPQPAAQTTQTTQTTTQPTPSSTSPLSVAKSMTTQASQAASQVSQPQPQEAATAEPFNLSSMSPIGTGEYDVRNMTREEILQVPGTFRQKNLLYQWDQLHGGEQASQQASQPSATQASTSDFTDPNSWFQEQTRTALEAARQTADKNLIDGITKDLIPFEERNLEEEAALIQKSYDEQMLRLNSLEESAQEALRLQQEAIYSGEAAMKASADTVYQANKAAVDYQRQKTEQAYIEMVNLQELDNKKRQTTLELTMSRYGTYDFAQLKGYQEQIMVNTQKVLNLKKEADIEDQKFTDEAKTVNLQYQEQQKEIQAWKSEALSATYKDYRDYITKLVDNKNMTTTQKYEAMISARDKANSRIADLNAKSLELQHSAVYDAAARAEELIARKNEAIEKAKEWERAMKEDYSAQMENIVGNYVGTDYSELGVEAKAKLKELEDKLELPSGFAEQALKRLNDEVNKDEFEWHGTEVDDKGNLVAIGVQNGKPVSVSLGKVAKATNVKAWDIKEVGGEIVKYNKETGEYERLSPSDYSAMSEYVSDQAVSSVVGQEIASAYPDGSHGGQCGSFLHNFVDMSSLGGWGNEISVKKTKMNRSTQDLINDPRPGDVILTNENSVYGHVMIINEVLEGGKVRVTESNYMGPEKVSNTRIIDLNSPASPGGNPFNVLGSYRGPLKSRFEEVRQNASENAYTSIGDAIQKYGVVGGLANSAFNYFTKGEEITTESNAPSSASPKLSNVKTIQDMQAYMLTNYGKTLTKAQQDVIKKSGDKGVAVFQEFVGLLEEREQESASKKSSSGRVSLDELLK